jgi:hypothetical protein
MLIGASTSKSGREKFQELQASCEEGYAQPNLGRNQVRMVMLCGRSKERRCGWEFLAMVTYKNGPWGLNSSMGLVKQDWGNDACELNNMPFK